MNTSTNIIENENNNVRMAQIPNQIQQSNNQVVDNNINNSTSVSKKGGKIIFNEDPIAFEIKEVVDKDNEESDLVQRKNNSEEEKELPKEQSGNITF